MTIVPLDGIIEIEAHVLNHDIGFIEIGQLATVKLDAFPFTRYGTIDGTVVKVVREAVDDREATSQADTQAVAQSKGTSPVRGNQQNLVFPTIVALKQSRMSIDGRDIPLMPGMMVTVEIKTGQRRVIDYILSPLREVTARVGSER